MVRALARRARARDPARRLSGLHRPALASAARDDRPRADQPPRRARPGSCAGARRPRWTSWSRRPASASSSSASTNGASSPCRSPSGSRRDARSPRRTAARPAGRGGARSLWLAFLAPFFYLDLRRRELARVAARRTSAPSCSAGNAHIPFLGWTIIPYWSINAFYGLSLFVCATRDELDTHGRRLLTAQVVAVACFILFPLRFTFEQPATDGGLPAFCSTRSASFDKPFNQAPSLHIALLVILWALYARHVPRLARCAAAHLVRADRRFGADHLSAPFHRHPDRRAARVRLPVALAGRGREPVRRRAAHARPQAPQARDALRHGSDFACGRSQSGSVAWDCSCFGRHCRSASSRRTTDFSARPASKSVRTAR